MNSALKAILQRLHCRSFCGPKPLNSKRPSKHELIFRHLHFNEDFLQEWKRRRVNQSTLFVYPSRCGSVCIAREKKRPLDLAWPIESVNKLCLWICEGFFNSLCELSPGLNQELDDANFHVLKVRLLLI